MTDRVKNQPGPSTIVKNTQLWPTSFTKPEKQTRVCIRTYIFRDSNKVQKFLDFLKEKFPNRNVDVKQLDNGEVSVSLTSLLAEPGITNFSTNILPCSKRKCCKSYLVAKNTSEICCVYSPRFQEYGWACCSNPCQTRYLSKCGTGKKDQVNCGTFSRNIVSGLQLCSKTCTS